MLAKGDARRERQSSWPGAARRARLGWTRNYVRFAFAGFVLLHSSCKAYRAATAGALPEPGPETSPWFVGTVLLAVWLPFMIFAAAELCALRQRPEPGPVQAQQRALAKVEPLALSVVLAFALLHGVQLAWPLLVGRLTAVDLPGESIAILSSTRSGLPLQAIAALCAVGAGSFYAVRQLQHALPDARPTLVRAVIAVGVLSYVLGSYAVIRSASGTLLP